MVNLHNDRVVGTHRRKAGFIHYIAGDRETPVR